MSPPIDAPRPGYRPVGVAERIEVLDVLRGFALLLVILFNVFIFAGYDFISEEGRQALATSTLDSASLFLRHLFVENKGFTLFSLMFGIGFGIMARRARRAGRSVVAHLLRRQGVLLGIGLLHATLLWGGDILAVYAVLGLFLLPFLGRSDKTVLISAGVLYLLPIPLYALGMVVDLPDPYTLAAGVTAEPNLFGIWMSGFGEGDYAQVVQGNLAFLAMWWAMVVVNLYWPDILGMFLLGLYVGRSGWIDRLQKEPGVLPRRLWIAAGVLGVAGNTVFATLLFRGAYDPPSLVGLVGTVVQYLAVPLLAFFYVATLVRLYHRAGWRRRLGNLGAVGRMTLTNYLLQSLVCLFVFYEIGLGLFTEVGASVAVLIALVVFSGQVLFSRWWWSAGFSYGPVEWIWRQLTYRTRLPLRSPRGLAPEQPTSYVSPP